MAINTIDIKKLLETGLGVRSAEFPGTDGETATEPTFPSRNQYQINSFPPEKQYEINGTPLYRQNHRGIWYFMPVFLRRNAGYQETGGENEMIELQHALISVTGRKTIVETPLVGRKGTVKEVINIDESTIKISAFLHSDDNTFPDDKVAALKSLWELNESLEIICVLTDLLLDDNVQVVITDMNIPQLEGMENGIKVDLTLKTDSEFELIQL